MYNRSDHLAINKSQDENIMNFVENFKERYGIQKKNYIKKSKSLLAKGRQMTSDFALDPDELENIFDLIAQEHPELWENVVKNV